MAPQQPIGNLTGKVLANFRQQLARAVRFRRIFITASGPRLLFFHIRGNGYDRDRSGSRSGTDLVLPDSSHTDWQS
jgi:hypothetical protein